MSTLPYIIEIDSISRHGWENLITEFEDASLFQTWSYGFSQKSFSSVSHIISKEDQEAVGCCQVIIKRFPFLSFGVADITRGPLFIRRRRAPNPDVVVHLLNAIKEEYAIKRGCLLRIGSHAVGDIKEVVKETLVNMGFSSNLSERPYRSLRINLTLPMDELRNNLHREWRRCLKKAEEKGLSLVEGVNNDIFDILIKLAKEVEANKKFIDATDYEMFRRIQNDLPEPQKIRIVVCELYGEPVCAAGYSAIGDTGYYTLAGTGKKAYGLNATHLVQWHMVKRLKEKGVRYFDLGPFNPQRNPGVYHFKKGLAGKGGWEETFLGVYEGCFNFRNRIAKYLLESVKLLRKLLRTRKSYDWKPPKEEK